jgi:mono/diheme cytochrome c family protein
MKWILIRVGSAIAALVVLAAIWLALVYAGFYNVAASENHTKLVEWTLETIKERSVARRAGELPAPLPTDSLALLHGFEHYRAMCEVCHGAPGVERGEVGEGLSPRPPRLQRAAREWTDAELFWITKHGIKATGMPAFGSTHDDASLLQIVAIVRRLPDMTPERYAGWVQALETSGLAGHHDAPADSVAEAPPHAHAPGTPAHAH